MKSIIKEQREKVESYIYLKNIEGCQAGSDICGLKNKKGEFICIHCERWNGQDRDVPAVSITPEELRDLHKQSLKQFIDGLIAFEEGRMVVLRDKEDHLPNAYQWLKGKNEARQETITHLKELKEELN